MWEETDGKEFEPSGGIRFGAMDEFERCGECAAESARNLVYHVDGVSDGKPPVLAAELFFSEVSTCHTYNGLPGTFHQTIGRLSVGRSSDKARVGLFDPTQGFATNELLVKVGMEEFGYSAVTEGPKVFEGGDDFIGGESLESKYPTVPCSHINKQQGVSESTEGEAVAIYNVHVDFVEEVSSFSDRFTTGWFVDGDKVTNSRREFTRVNKVTVGRGRDDVLLVFKFSTSKNAMEFEIVK